MALDDYELNLQTEIVSWKCSRNADCLMEFIRRPPQMKVGMRGLVWSIEALTLHTPTEYSFNIMDVKRSETPLSLSEAAVPNLPAKFELLLTAYKASIKSLCRTEEALDKLYAFTHLFSLAEKDRKWWIILDAEITTMACECARETHYQAAQVAVSILIDQVESPVSIGSDRKRSERFERSGWWIDNWTVADEFWASGFFPLDSWKCMMRVFLGKAVEGGNVFQWCTVRVFDEPNPNFQFEVAVHEFLDGDDVLLRIGVANDRKLTVRVFLNEAVKVVCSQEGVETETSLGLAFLLPEMVRDYVSSALEINEAELSNNNVVQGLVQHLIRYLAFLGQICLICGSDRLSDVPRSSTCSDTCKATKQRYEDAIVGRLPDLEISEKARATRREQYVKKLHKNSNEGRTGLGTLLERNVVDKAKTGKHKNDGAISYQEAVRRVTKLNSRSVARALHVQISELWIDDAEAFEN